MDFQEQLSDNPAAQRFEMRQGDQVVGFLQYASQDGAMHLTHTDVQPAQEGKGVGSRLAAFALDQARARGLRVVPSCPFIAAYIERHPQYGDLVA